MTDAIALAEWYVMEALRLQQAGRRNPKLVQAQALLEWFLARNGDEVPFREVLQFGPGMLRTKDAAEQAIGILINHGWVVEVCPRPRRFRVLRSGAP